MTGEFSDVSGATGPEGHAGPIELTEDDFDLLADYVGGALTGTPAQDEVARRIADDPGWRRAHEALSGSMDTVRAHLAAWGHAPEPMPADVADRLAVRLHAEPRQQLGNGSRQDDTLVPRHDDTPAPGQRADAARLSAVPGKWSAGARPRRRWTSWAGPLAAAAAVLAFCGFGLQALPQSDGDGGAASDSGGAALGRSPAPEAGRASDGSASALAALPVRRLVASGADYRRDSVGAAGQALAADGDTRSVTPERTFAGAAPRLAASDVDPALRRLTAPTALAACLAAIGGEHPSPATAVELVDYASFEGAPALIVIFTDAGGDRWSWVAGPRCGLVGAGAQTRFQTRVR